MSSPPDKNQSTPVVQTILESFTRCFNPLESACTEANSSRSAGNTGGRSSSNSSSASANSSQLFGYNIGSCDARAVSRSSSSSDSRKKTKQRQQQQISLDASYDADGVARAKRTHYRLSAEAIEERSMKRKLEIFRGTSEQQEHQQQEQQRKRPSESPPPPTSSSRSSPSTPSSRGSLVLSDDEEELVRLTQSRKRFACGMNMDRLRPSNNSPIASVAKLFNLGLSEAQRSPFGLCFATPVRCKEDVDDLPDDEITDEEFMQRHSHHRGSTNAPLKGTTTSGLAQISPELDHSSYCEEETISSTLYFDQKYSHVVQTRPPMPLFQEHMLDCDASNRNDLSKMIREQQTSSKKNAPPVEMITSKKSPRKRGNTSNTNTIVSPTGSSMESPRRGPRGSSKDMVPSPMRIRDESLSAADSEDNSFVQRLLEPDMSMTAAEI